MVQYRWIYKILITYYYGLISIHWYNDYETPNFGFEIDLWVDKLGLFIYKHFDKFIKGMLINE